MANEGQTGRHPTASDQSRQYSTAEDRPEEYAAHGFHPIDRWSKVLLGLIVIFSIGIFLPVLANRELTIAGAPWLFYAYPVSILVLSTTWLIISYTVVD